MYMVLDKDYVTSFVDKHVDQAMDDFTRADEKNSELTKIMEQISALRVERKVAKAKKGVDLKCKSPLVNLSQSDQLICMRLSSTE